MKKVARLVVMLLLICSTMSHVVRAEVNAPNVMNYKAEASFNAFTAQELGIRQPRISLAAKAYVLDGTEWLKIVQSKSSTTTTLTEYLQVDVTKMDSKMKEIAIMVFDVDRNKVIATKFVENNSTIYIPLPIKGMDYVVYGQGDNANDIGGLAYIAIKSIYL